MHIKYVRKSKVGTYEKVDYGHYKASTMYMYEYEYVSYEYVS